MADQVSQSYDKVEGVLQDKVMRQKKTGDRGTYWVYTVGGKKYSQFENNNEDLQVGDFVTGKAKVKMLNGREFFNLYYLKKVDKEVLEEAQNIGEQINQEAGVHKPLQSYENKDFVDPAFYGMVANQAVQMECSSTPDERAPSLDGVEKWFNDLWDLHSKLKKERGVR